MFTLLLLLAVAGDPTQGPALTVEPGVIDFGDVPQEFTSQRSRRESYRVGWPEE